jgi:hypothetical protein
MWFGSRNWLTTSRVLCRKSTDLTGTRMNPARQWLKRIPRQPLRSPLPPPKQAPAVEATLPEASVVEGEYTT